MKVHALTTIGDDAQQGHRFGQILSGLCFAGTSWSGRCTTHTHGQRLGDGQVDAIGEWCDHQTSVKAHVLVAVVECACI